jgi:hypothetical protein
VLRIATAAGATAAGVFAATLACAGTAHAGQVLKVDDGKARMVRDRLLPPASKTALPPVPGHTRLLAPAVRARAASLPYWQRREYDAALADARRTRDALPPGPARDEPPEWSRTPRRSTLVAS